MLARPLLALAVIFVSTGGCDAERPTIEPTSVAATPPAATASSTPLRTPNPSPTAGPAPSPFVAAPKPVVMSTGVPATVACGVPASRTLTLTELGGTMAYGYESELARYSLRDDERSNPPPVAHYLSSCNLATGFVSRLDGPAGHPFIDADGAIRDPIYIVDFNLDRLLLHVRGRGEAPGESWLLDTANGGLTPLAFADDAVTPVGFDDFLVLGEQTLHTSRYETMPTILSLQGGYTPFRSLTSYDIGVTAARLVPVAIGANIVVGNVDEPVAADAPPIFAYALQGDDGIGAPIDIPWTRRGWRAAVTAFDGQTIAGWATRDQEDAIPKPWAWSFGDPQITWLPLPEDQRGGTPMDVAHGIVVGISLDAGDGADDAWYTEARGIAWELASGAFLDLGTGPSELSGTMVSEGGRPPQSLAASVEDHRILGFLGEGCSDCSPANYGGTPIVWDVADWLASIRP